MGTIKFIPIGYWNKKTMKLGEPPSAKDFSNLRKLCNRLTGKYAGIEVCKKHPEKEVRILVNVHNQYIDFNFAPADTCGCYDAMLFMAKIRDYETLMHNGHSNTPNS